MRNFLAHAHIRLLGSISYDDAMRIQDDEYRKVRAGMSNGCVLLLEHSPAVITLGRRADAASLLHSENELAQKGYHVRKATRGGLATVHEPGQAVVYFVVPIPAKSSARFVQFIMRLTAEFLKNRYGIIVEYDESRPGLWWHHKKLCACGFDFSGGVSRHGIAINVCNNLEGFSMIVPCGIQGAETISASEILGQKIPCEEFIAAFGAHIREVVERKSQ